MFINAIILWGDKNTQSENFTTGNYKKMLSIILKEVGHHFILNVVENAIDYRLVHPVAHSYVCQRTVQ